MTDIFKEQLVKRKSTAKDQVIKFLLIMAATIVFFIAMIFLASFGVIIGAIAGFAAYMVIGRLNKEFEYSFTNGELDIDVIYNRSSRKRMFSGEVKNFELMAHVNDTSHQHTFSTAQVTKDYSTGVVSDRSYAFFTNYLGKPTKIIIEPNDEMLAVISKALGRRRFFEKK